MQKTFKRTLSLLLAVVMLAAVFTVAPVAVSAAETDAAAVGDPAEEMPEREISVGQNMVLNMPAESVEWIKFAPTEDMNIAFYAICADGKYTTILPDLYDESKAISIGGVTDEFTSDPVLGDYYKFKTSVTANTVYYFKLFNYSELSLTFYLDKLSDWEHYEGTITRYNGREAQITVPSKLDNFTITEIGDGAFRDLNITSVTIPEGITSIGASAFSDCKSLYNVKLPETLTSIGDSAFWSCSSLSEIEFPSALESIGEYAFQECALTEVKLPDSLKNIGENAFYECLIQEVVIPASVTKIGAYAFTTPYSSSSKGLCYVTILNESNGDEVDGEEIDFNQDAFNSTNTVILFQCYPGSVAEKIYVTEDHDNDLYGYYADRVAYLGGSNPTVTFKSTKDSSVINTLSANGAVKMPAQGNAKNGNRAFLGWSTKPDDTKPSFKVGEIVPIKGDITLYAVWANVIEFYDNDGTTLLGTYKGDNYNDGQVACAYVQLPDKPGSGFMGFYTNPENDKEAKQCYFIGGSGWSAVGNVSYSDYDETGVFKLYAKWAEGVPDIYLGQSISLDGVIRMNFYVKKGYGVGEYGQKKICGWNTEAPLEDTAIGEETRTTAVEAGDDYDKVSLEIYAKEMTDKHTVAYCDYSKGYAIVKTYSVKEYLETLMDKPESLDNLKELCYATLNYGAASQIYFNYHTERPANEKVPKDYKAAEPTGLTYDKGSQEDFSFCDLSYYASSLGLYADTSYSLAFEQLNDSYYDSGTPELQYFVTGVLDSQNQATYSPVEYNGVVGNWVSASRFPVGTAYHTTADGSRYSRNMVAYAITSIAAKDLLTDIPVRFATDTFVLNEEYGYYDTIKQYSDVYIFNPQTYLAKVLYQDGVDPEYTDGESADGSTYNAKDKQSKENLVKTVEAIYDYHVKAKAYFPN